MLTDKEFQRIVKYIHDNYGIDLSQKRTLVMGRMENYLLRNGYNSYDEYMVKVERDPKGEEATNLVNVLTTNHTYFMRESVHFDFLRDTVIPELKQKEAGRKDIRIWSGASSTGEEPYTLEMILLDAFGLDQGWNTQLLATDISQKVLAHATKGVYLNEQIEPLPDNWKRKYFQKYDSDHYQAKQFLRDNIVYRQFNLMDPLPFRRKFHVVFLRNVMIYFKEDTKYDLVQRIYDKTEPGGYLFIGTTEGLERSRTPFQYVQPSIYRKAPV